MVPASSITAAPLRRQSQLIATLPESPAAREISIFFSSFSPSCFRKFVVHALQALAQLKYRIPLAREQGVHADASLVSHLFETLSFYLVTDEYRALLRR